MVQQSDETDLDACTAAINLVANLIFTPIQFGMRNLLLASVDILVIWTTIIRMMVVIEPYSRWMTRRAKRLEDDSLVHSFRTPLDDLACIVSNVCRCPHLGPDAPTFNKMTIPNPKQQRALQLLQAISL